MNTKKEKVICGIQQVGTRETCHAGDTEIKSRVWLQIFAPSASSGDAQYSVNPQETVRTEWMHIQEISSNC